MLEQLRIHSHLREINGAGVCCGCGYPRFACWFREFLFNFSLSGKRTMHPTTSISKRVNCQERPLASLNRR
jgi:hypothetical protein